MNSRSNPTLGDPPDPPSADRLQRRAEARRLEILRAAAAVFRRQGYAATGMRDIAAAADLSPGNLYYYFSGKDEILFFCQDRALDRLHAGLESAASADVSPRDRLHRVIEHHVVTLLDSFDGGTAHLALDALPPERRGHIVARRDLYEAGLRQLIRDGVEANAFAPCDAALVVRAILGASNWPALWFRPEGDETVHEVARGLADYLTRGLLARTDSPAGIAAQDTGNRRPTQRETEPGEEPT